MKTFVATVVLTVLGIASPASAAKAENPCPLLEERGYMCENQITRFTQCYDGKTVRWTWYQWRALGLFEQNQWSGWGAYKITHRNTGRSC